MKVKILFSSIYKTINRQGKSERPAGIIWLENNGIKVPHNIDFYTVLLFVPFIFSMGYGLTAEAKLFDETYGLNIIISGLILISVLAIGDYYHSLNYFDINLNFLKITPVSNSEVFWMKFLVEVFGYKLYILFCSIIMLTLFNYTYVENIINYLPPKSLILLLNYYISYCLLGLLVKRTTRIIIKSKWMDIIIKLIAVFIIIILINNFQPINDFKKFISQKARDILNNQFWFIQVTLLGFLFASTLLLRTHINWKR